MISDNPKHRPHSTHYQAHIIAADRALAQLSDELDYYCTETETRLFAILQSELDWLSNAGRQLPPQSNAGRLRAGY